MQTTQELANHALVAAKVEHVALQMDVLQEIRRHLAPFSVEGHPISGETVISDATTVDSLTIMDMVMELEDRFDVTIPMNLVAEVRTVNQLADTILALSAKH
jgi:acyl carrier protein